MLRDRIELLEHDLAELKARAGKMYLGIVVGHIAPGAEYEQLKDRIASMSIDLELARQLVEQGHK